MPKDYFARIAAEALEIEQEEARAAGALGYMARILVQVTMPHKETGTGAFERVNGCFSLSMLAPPWLGLPYGRYPRLLLAWITTEAVKTRRPRLELGESLSAFLRALGIQATGGRWGTIHRLRAQMKRLFSTTISCTYQGPGEFRDAGFRIVTRTQLWWSPQSPDQAALWGSYIDLTREFFETIIERPVPVDLRVLRVLRSPLAIDIYTWLTYRYSYLRKPVEIPWPALALQFGSSYAESRVFRFHFLRHARQIVRLYPTARIAEGDQGLILRPAAPHVARVLPHVPRNS